MRVLVIKMTSMGDVLHVMPALSDLHSFLSDQPFVQIDWMVEENFAQLPSWHPAVNKTLAVASRRWRSLRWQNLREFWCFIRELRKTQYDLIIDAQGLMKSAIFGRFAQLARGGIRVGFSGDSIKESPAAWLYSKRVQVPRNHHAVERLRQLFAGAVNQPTQDSSANYGLRLPNVEKQPGLAPRSVFIFHGTTWNSKHVPEALWRQIIDQLIQCGYAPVLCWANQVEFARAQNLTEGFAAASVLPKQSLQELAQQLRLAAGAIAVDTGLGHMAAAFNVPCVSLYGATDPMLTGTYGDYQTQMQVDFHCAPCLRKECDKLNEAQALPPCYATLNAEAVVDSLLQQIRLRDAA